MIYLIHFDRPLHHARHYLGYCADGTLEVRLIRHRAGRGRPASRCTSRTEHWLACRPRFRRRPQGRAQTQRKFRTVVPGVQRATGATSPALAANQSVKTPDVLAARKDRGIERSVRDFDKIVQRALEGRPQIQRGPKVASFKERRGAQGGPVGPHPPARHRTACQESSRSGPVVGTACSVGGGRATKLGGQQDGGATPDRPER